ncbi:MAG TPA: beta-propeller fold lactonase family protein [Candidatus Sulfotelmatobacter sp.]
MSTRFTWMPGVVILVSLGLLAGCGGSHYKASSDGLVIVPSQGAAVVQSFSFNLSTGHVSTINSNPAIPGPPDQGTPASIVLDPTGSFAYVTSVSNPCSNASVIATYAVKSDGTLSAIGSQALSANVYPTALAIDSAGKYLFVSGNSTCAAGSVSVFSIGSNASLSEVPGSPFAVPTVLGAGTANLVALAVSPTTFPAQFAACSSNTPPSSEFLYVADAQTNSVWEFAVSSTGSLVLPATGYTTGSIPSGVAIDPCNRFLYVSNQLSNNVSAFTVCASNSPTQTCSGNPAGTLVPVARFSAGSGPGPLVVSPFGNFLYVLDKTTNLISGEISGFQISQASGSLTPTTPATTATGNNPVSIAVRGDGNWLFVTNNGSSSGNGSLSQYIITPSSGALAPSGTGVLTDTYPWGIAVK